MKNFFKLEDFYSKSMFQEYIGSPISGKVIKVCDAVEYANQKLNAEIEKWPMVYAKSYYGFGISYWHEDGGGVIDIMKRARLAFIEEIPKKECIHEPGFDFSAENSNKIGSLELKFKTRSFCKHCGKKLKASWSVDEQ